MNEVSWKKSKRIFTKINDRLLTMSLAKDVKPQDIRNLRDLNFQSENISREFLQGRF